MFELSCTLSPNDRHRNTETACQLFDSNSDPNLRGQGLPDSVELQQWTYFSVQDVLEDAMFSTASWIRLFCTFTFFFLFSLAFPLKWLTFVCLSFTSLQDIIQRMYIGREPGISVSAVDYVGLCQTDLSDARGGAWLRNLVLPRFIVIEHPHLSNRLSPILPCRCWRGCFLLKQETISCLCSKTPWIIMMVGLDSLGSYKGHLFLISHITDSSPKEVQRHEPQRGFDEAQRLYNLSGRMYPLSSLYPMGFSQAGPWEGQGLQSCISAFFPSSEDPQLHHLIVATAKAVLE